MNPVLAQYKMHLRIALRHTDAGMRQSLKKAAAMRFAAALFARHGDAVLNHMDCIVAIREQAEKEVVEEETS